MNRHEGLGQLWNLELICSQNMKWQGSKLEPESAPVNLAFVAQRPVD